jgi:putative oxidoreductase
MSAPSGAIVLGGRILFGLYFGAIAGVGHIRRSSMYEGHAKQTGFPIAAITGWPVGVWLLAGALSVAVGVWPDLGSLMIAVFVVPAGLFFHAFWKVEDRTQRRTQRDSFWRNVVYFAASMMMFGMFASLGPALRFTVTRPLFRF